MLNTLFLEGVTEERQFRAPRLSRSARISPLSLKKIHPQGTRDIDSAEGIRSNYRWARVKKQTERFPGHLI